MPLVSNQVLQDRYEVVRSIKSGGMGAVYEAIDRKLAATPCAIKEVLCSALEGSNAQYVLNSFESEMRSLANLDHPSIPRVRDYFEIDGRRYIVLDYVKGKALDDELQEHLRLTGEPMDPYVAVLDMIGVLETLTYLHSQRPAVVHRDVKPANLIRDDRSGRIKLVDFGIARSVESQQMNTSVGTPGFCAPEQAGGRAEPRSDLYSVGATLFNLVTGTLPPPFAFDSLEPDLPRFPGLAAVIKKATSVKAANRYADAEQMANALRNWAHGRVVQPASQPAPPSLPEPPQMTPINPLARPAQPANVSNGTIGAGILVLLIASYALFPKSPVEKTLATATPRPVPVAAVTSAPEAPSRKPAAPVRKPVARRSNPVPAPPPPPVAAARRVKRAQMVQQAAFRQPQGLDGPNYPRRAPGQGVQRRVPVVPAAWRPADPPAGPSAETVQPGVAERMHARRHGLRVVKDDGTSTLYGKPMGDYRLGLRIWRRSHTPMQEMLAQAPSLFGIPANGPVRRQAPPGQYCFQDPANSNHFYHFKDGLVIQTIIDGVSASRVGNWQPIFDMVDNWPSP